MSAQDQISLVNQRQRERMVREGCGFARPWLELDPDLVRQYALGQLEPRTMAADGNLSHEPFG